MSYDLAPHAATIGAGDGFRLRLVARAVNYVDALLIVGIVLSTQTKLRLAGLPIGIGEVLLLVWMWLAVARSLRVRLPVGSNGPNLYWIAFGVLFCISVSLSVTVFSHVSKTFLHDSLAFSLLIPLFGLVYASGMYRDSSTYINTFFYLAAALTAALFALALAGVGGGLFWYGEQFGGRFAGLCNNPNQYALLLVMLPMLGLHVVKSQSLRWFQMVTVFGLIAVVLLAGLYSKSDALLLAWAVSLGALAALWFPRVAAFSFVAMVATGILYASELSALAASAWASADEGYVRVALWRHGLMAFLDSPIVGHGPGAHSGIGGPYSGSEAHSLFVDFAASFGAVGLLLLGFMLYSVLRCVLRSGSPYLVVAFIALLTFAQFHYIIRHPLFWFALVLFVGAPPLISKYLRARPATGET